MKKIRLLPAENHQPALQWLACLVSDEHQIVGTVAEGRALVTAAAEFRLHRVRAG